MTFLFKTSATMKPYNNKKWWIDSGIVRPVTVDAETMEEAIKEYRTIVQDDYYITISENALKNKEPIYRDDKEGNARQVGYIFTGQTDFDNDGRGWVKQFIDLWVSIAIITNPFEGVTV